MPVFQCDRKTIEYSGILQFLVRVFSQVLLREIVRCPLPTSALSLLDIQLKGDGHLAKVHVIGSDGLAIAAHPPLGEGGSGLQRGFSAPSCGWCRPSAESSPAVPLPVK